MNRTILQFLNPLIWILIICIGILFSSNIFAQQSELNKKKNWLSNIEVARKVLARFDVLDTYMANFDIEVKQSNGKRKMRGKVYYKKPSKLRYEFTSPKNNLVISDGKIMWFYIDRLKVVGKQSLTAKSKEAEDNFFAQTPVSGLRRLFSKYHYRFDTLEQPRQIKTIFDKDKTILSYIFLLEQREKIGGYHTLKLFVDSSRMLVYQVEGDDGYGKQTRISFSNIRENPQLEGKLFSFKVESDMSIVSNPLVDEEDR